MAGAFRSLVTMRKIAPSVADDHDLPNRRFQRFFAAPGKPRRQIADPVGDDIAAFRHVVLVDRGERRILLEPGHEAAARIIESRPPAKIVVAKVVDVGHSSLDRHGFGRRDVVDVGGVTAK